MQNPVIDPMIDALIEQAKAALPNALNHQLLEAILYSLDRSSIAVESDGVRLMMAARWAGKSPYKWPHSYGYSYPDVDQYGRP